MRHINLKKLVNEYRLPLTLAVLGVVLMVSGSLISRLSEKTESSEQSERSETSVQGVSGTVSTVQNEFELYADYEERRLTSILSQIDGAGEVQAVVYVGATPSDDGSGLLFPEIKGVLIYAEGAGRESVKEKIVRAVAVLYSLSLSDISVLS